MHPSLRHLLRTHPLRRWVRHALRRTGARPENAQPVVIDRGVTGCPRPCLELLIGGESHYLHEADDCREAAGLAAAARLVLADLCEINQRTGR